MVQIHVVKVHLTPKYLFRSNKSLHLFETHCAFLPRFNPNLDFLQAVKVTNLAIIFCTTEQVRGMGLFLGGHHWLIRIVLNLCRHAHKEVCDVNPGIDPYPFFAQSCNRWWPDFVTFTACKKSRFGLQTGKKAQCISNRCKDLFERKKYFGVRCTLIEFRLLHKRRGWMD